MRQASTRPGTYEVITQPNMLKQRLGAGAGIDAGLARTADLAVAQMRAEFRERARDGISQIEVLTGHLNQTGDGHESTKRKIQQIAEDLQHQGAAFDYPLVGDVCASLCGYLESLPPAVAPSVAVVGAHTRVLRLVVDRALAGDGGYEGLALLEELHTAVNCAPR